MGALDIFHHDAKILGHRRSFERDVISIRMQVDIELALLHGQAKSIARRAHRKLEQVEGQSTSTTDDDVYSVIEQYGITVTVDDITAEAGRVDVRADQLYGSGLIDAPGDASITIQNSTPAFLVFNDVIIPNETGGLYLNGDPIAGNADIFNAVDEGQTAGTVSFSSLPIILVKYIGKGQYFPHFHDHRPQTCKARRSTTQGSQVKIKVGNLMYSLQRNHNCNNIHLYSCF